MNIYLVSRSEHDWDEYDGFVIAAGSEAETLSYLEAKYNADDYGEWPNEGIKSIELIGTTDKYTELTEILSSFNAG